MNPNKAPKFSNSTPDWKLMKSAPASAIAPTNSTLFRGMRRLGSTAPAGALFMSFQSGVELLNFGALFGFMGVNLAALVRYFLRSPARRLVDFAAPTAGLLIC